MSKTDHTSWPAFIAYLRQPEVGYREHSKFGNFSSILSCSMCLWSVGLGYDRITRLLHERKGRVENFIRKRIIKGSNRNLIAQIKIKKPSPKKDPSIKLEKMLRNRTQLKLRKILRSKLWKALFSHSKSPSTEAMIGCSIPVLRSRFTLQFKRGMTWSNYGRCWEIDHIIPCRSFDLTKPSEVQKCFHFSNMRPEHKTKNRRKSGKILPCQPELILSASGHRLHIQQQDALSHPATVRPLPTLKTGSTGPDQQHATSGQHQTYAHDRPQ